MEPAIVTQCYARDRAGYLILIFGYQLNLVWVKPKPASAQEKYSTRMKSKAKRDKGYLFYSAVHERRKR